MPAVTEGYADAKAPEALTRSDSNTRDAVNCLIRWMAAAILTGHAGLAALIVAMMR